MPVPLRSLAFFFALVFVGGCGGSEAKTGAEVKSYTAVEVRDALHNHGFDVEVLSDDEQWGTISGLLELFSGNELEGVTGVVTRRGRLVPDNNEDTGYFESTSPPGDVIEAWIFDHEVTADRGIRSCGEPDAVTTCLQERNVMIIVGNKRSDAARAALNDLASGATRS